MKILVGYLKDGQYNGIDVFLITMLKYLVDTDIHLDFITNKKTEQLENLLKQYNSCLFEVPRLIHPIKQYQIISSLIEKYKYDGLYFNISETFNIIGVLSAYNHNLKKIIVHSHNSKAAGNNFIIRIIRTIINNIFKSYLNKWTTDRLACSDFAGKWLYDKNTTYEIISNAVDYSKFKYNEKNRNIIREKLKIQDKKVLGHISNFRYQKNTTFLIDLISKLNDDFRLMLIGEGDNFTVCKQLSKKLNVENKIIFLGKRQNVNEYIQAMDAFLLPSFFEGLPIVTIEAQFSGCPIFVSKNITKEIIVNNNCFFLNLNIDEWKKSIEKNISNREKEENVEKNSKSFTLEYQKEKILNVFRR